MADGQRVLITGATGFTGARLANYLHSLGLQCIGLSLRGDRRGDVAFLTEKLTSVRPDYVFHLAGVPAGGGAGETFRANVLYATTLLRALAQAGLEDRPVLLPGSGAEYGKINQSELPLTEEVECRPLNYYGMSKLMQTEAGLACARMEGRPIVVARPFNIIGREMPKHLVLASFVRQLEEIRAGTRPAVIEAGNLAPIRDFIDVDDVVRLYWGLIQERKAYGQVFNVCTGIPTSIDALLHGLIQSSGMRIEVKVNPLLRKTLDVPVHYGCNKKIQDMLGVFQYTSVEEILDKCK